MCSQCRFTKLEYILSYLSETAKDVVTMLKSMDVNLIDISWCTLCWDSVHYFLIKRKCIWLTLIVIYYMFMSHWWTIICSVRLASLYGNILCNVIVSVEENKDEFKCLICNIIVYSTLIFSVVVDEWVCSLIFSRNVYFTFLAACKRFSPSPSWVGAYTTTSHPDCHTYAHPKRNLVDYCFIYQPLISTMARICSLWIAGRPSGQTSDTPYFSAAYYWVKCLLQ